MAITTRYATNTAMQYNEVDISDFLINPSVGSRRFLIEAEQTRLLRATETSALYFITDTSGTFYSARYRWYDSGGTMLNEYILSLSSAGVHNSIPVDWSSFYIPSGAVKMTVAIIGAVNGFSNGDFSQGTGNTFTSWTLTQPSRTNLVQRSQEFDNAYWTKTENTITANATTAPDGTTTADKIVESVTANIEHSVSRSAITISSGLDYTFSLYAKPAGRDWIVIQLDGAFAGSPFAYFNIATGVVGTTSGTPNAEIFPDENGFYRIKITRPSNATSANVFIYTAAADNDVNYTGDGTSGVYVWGAQLDQSSQATPYISTTNASVTTSLGEFLQDATGGPDASRCIKMWVDTSGVTTRLTQNVSLVNGTDYIIRFWARVDELQGNDYLTGPSDATLIDSTEWKLYEQTFNWISGTGTFPLDFDFTNDANYGFIYIDKVSVAPINQPELSEVRTFILDDSCVAYEYQLNWLNKLGGRDTWVMTGYPTETVEVNRNNQIEYSQRTNYTSPNRIYGYRENKSRKSITLTHQCKDRRTAEWLKSELIDSIDVMLLIDGVYYPCDVVPSSIVIRNTFSQDYTIRLTLRYAYDINVQTR